MRKKIVIGIIAVVLLCIIVFAVLYKFKRNVLYSIYDSIIYVKQAVEVGLSDKYNKDIDKSKTYYKHERNIRIPILIYHRIVDEEPTRDMAYMNTTYKNFEKQIAGLLDYGYTVISYADLIAYNKGEKALPEKVVLITFDDGYQGVYDYAYKVAKKYNIPMTTFVIDDLVGTGEYFNWEQARDMSNSGLISIYSHGKTHIKYAEKPKELLVEYTKQAHAHIEKELGKTVEKVFTYPYGSYTDEHTKALEEEGFVQNLTNDEINDSDNLNMSQLNRIYVLNHYSKYKVLKIIQ